MISWNWFFFIVVSEIHDISGYTSTWCRRLVPKQRSMRHMAKNCLRWQPAPLCQKSFWYGLTELKECSLGQKHSFWGCVCARSLDFENSVELLGWKTTTRTESCLMCFRFSQKHPHERGCRLSVEKGTCELLTSVTYQGRLRKADSQADSRVWWLRGVKIRTRDNRLMIHCDSFVSDIVEKKREWFEKLSGLSTRIMNALTLRIQWTSSNFMGDKEDSRSGNGGQVFILGRYWIFRMVYNLNIFSYFPTTNHSTILVCERIQSGSTRYMHFLKETLHAFPRNAVLVLFIRDAFSRLTAQVLHSSIIRFQKIQQIPVEHWPTFFGQKISMWMSVVLPPGDLAHDHPLGPKSSGCRLVARLQGIRSLLRGGVLGPLTSWRQDILSFILSFLIIFYRLWNRYILCVSTWDSGTESAGHCRWQGGL